MLFIEAIKVIIFAFANLTFLWLNYNMMNKLGKIRGIKERKTANDVFQTPLPVVLKLIAMVEIQENDIVLDPCRGSGAIYNNLPDYCQKDWAGVVDGRDFFYYDTPVDIIVSNPPFSLYTYWLIHCIKLNPQKLLLIMGYLNLTTKRQNY